MANLGTWAKKHGGDPVVARALKKLDTLKKVPKGVRHPFPVGDPKYHDEFTHEELKRAIAKAPVVPVPIDTLKSNGQESVKPERVAQYIRNPKGTRPRVKPGASHPTDHPIVLRDHGEDILFDGHHRTTAAWAMGRDNVDARLADLDALRKRKQDASR